MRYSKTIFKVLTIFLIFTQISFATSNPIPGIGIVIKRNPGGGSIKVSTGKEGGFSTQLEAGEYEVSFSQEQLQSAIGKLIKRNYPQGRYQYDGSGVEMALENSEIRINSKPLSDNIYSVNAQNSVFVISVPQGGATFSGVLNWNDEVFSNLGTENRGIDKADIRRTNNPYFKNSANEGEMVPMNRSVNENPLYEDKNKEGVNPLYGAQGKGIRENGLKKNAIDVSQEDNGTDASARTEGKLKGKIIKGGDNGMISVSDENQETPTARKGWDGSVKSGTATQRKGINEKGLKKNDAEISTTNSEKKGLNAVNVKLSKSNSEQASDLIDDANPTPQGHAVKTKGSGATSGPDVKPIKVEETKIGQPHP
jgi:hypothetical protein